MRLRVSDSRLARDLVRFFRARDYLAVEEGAGLVAVVPINAVSERADRISILREVEEWLAAHPDVRVEPIEE